MTQAVEPFDHKIDGPADKSASAGGDGHYRDVTDFLQLLARAARQFHTYPATNPQCTNAIDACHRAFAVVSAQGPLLVRVAPDELKLDEHDAGIGRGTIVEQELSRPLFRAHVASIEFTPATSQRDWSQLCAILASLGPRSRGKVNFAELLLDAGVGAIVARVTPRPEVLELATPSAAVQTMVERERARQAAAVVTSQAQHLYPPDKGWVRIDPAVNYDAISLADLTVLVSDPSELAVMLARLTDDDSGEAAHDGTALEQRYTDVVRLIGSVEPSLGRLLFSKLSRAVLELGPERRRALLRGAILPGLLDGRLEGEAVLLEFPDADLAEALCLLLDLEAAAPSLIPMTLERLRLSPERKASVVPLIEANVEARRSSDDTANDRWSQAGFDRRGAELTRVESDGPKNFGEFSAFDLAVTAQTSATLVELRDAIASTEDAQISLACAAGLARIEPNPAVVETMLARAMPSLAAMMRDRRWAQVEQWLTRLSQIAVDLETSRQDVTKTIRDSLQRVCTRDAVLQLADLCANEADRHAAAAIVRALGPSIVPSWLDVLQNAADRRRARPLTPVLSDSAPQLAPAIAERLPGLGSDAACGAIPVLALAGQGYEPLIAAQLTAGDERRSREALRALARIASEKAAALIAEQLEHGPVAVQPAAEEALWRLPATLAAAKTRELLGRREFVLQHPDVATRLLDRVGQGSTESFSPVFEGLAPLRFHFWRPAVARVGARARELMR